MPFLIAVDGPAGAGKSTVARRLARALDYAYVDTGAMYRAIALTALDRGLDEACVSALEEIAQGLKIRFSNVDEVGAQQVWIDDRDVTRAIRTPAVSDITSRISAIPSVRSIVVDQQRRIAESAGSGAVLEGRDIGTVVFPNARLKIYLTASAEERARRRVEEMRTQGIAVDPERTLSEMIERDERDSRRATSPLSMAGDAVPILTDGLSADEVVQAIRELWQERQP